MTRKRRSNHLGAPPGDHDGILDVLANLVGVLTLVGALSAVVAANAAVRIKTPMARNTNQSFVMLMVGRKGVWNLQPAKDALIAAKRQRYQEMRGCFKYSLFSIITCMDSVSSQVRSARVGQAQYLISDDETFLERTNTPDVSLEDYDSQQKLDELVQRISSKKKAIFVLLEKEGFEAYRKLRSAAANANVDMGWEPWPTAGSIYFSSGGRQMTVQ
jgi:hypothetical protein